MKLHSPILMPDNKTTFTFLVLMVEKNVDEYPT
jgi:hypothetical protein